MSLSLVFLAAFAASSGSTGRGFGPLHTSGNRVLDSGGSPVRLRGVNCASLEWSSDGEGHLLKTIQIATNGWNANLIRLPLSQDRWFGKGPEQKDGGIAYRKLVQSAVKEANKANCYVLLDLHWNDENEWGKNIGQHKMPDMNSLAFWKSCSGAYKNRPGVLFDLYNEPHDISWDVWLNGGDIHEDQNAGARQGKFVPMTFRSPGMQAVLNTIRSTGAMNVVVCGGTDWAYDLSGFASGKYRLKDRGGKGIIYACHNYPFKGDTPAKWESKMDAALPEIPVIMSEFGSDPEKGQAMTPSPWVEEVLRFSDSRKMNYTAWDLHPAAGPCLITGWDYKPTPHFGALIKEDLRKPTH